VATGAKSHDVEVDAREALLFDEPSQASGALADFVLVLWHGAGGDVTERSLTAVARAFADRGALAARARFPYRVAGRRAPDRMPALIESARAAVESVRTRPETRGRRLVLGGRSMGGRVASLLVASGFAADGLLLLSYPLHPAGRRDKLRDAHLPQVCCPMLFVTGDHDSLCDLGILRSVIAKLGRRATLSVFPGADHGFRRVPPGEVARVAVDWAEHIAAA